MFLTTAIRVQFLTLLLVAAHWTADAGEIVQREKAVPSGNVVRVRDLVELRGESERMTDELLDLELFLAPPSLKSLRVTREELQQAILLHGVSLRGWQWSGAEETTIVSRGGIPGHIQRLANAETARAPKKIEIVEPIAKIPTPAVAGPAVVKVVAASRPLNRGEIITASDVQLIPADTKNMAHGVFTVEEVVGKEVKRAILTGKPVEPSQLQAPRLVRRDDVVKVVSKAPGARVEVDAKALEEGAEGDVIQVITEADKQKILARVTGPRRLDVFASSPRYEVETKRGPSFVVPVGSRERE